LLIAGIFMFDVAGDRLRGVVPCLAQARRSGLSALIHLPVEADGKPNLVMGLPW